MRIENRVLAMVGVACAMVFAGCEVEKKKDGDVTLPKYEVSKTQEGNVTVPTYEVTTPDVTVKEKTVEVTVPAVEVKTASEKKAEQAAGK
ncbi:MAG: hypothetical protein ABIQ86_00835 [Steroidobacteraceae bacterium]